MNIAITGLNATDNPGPGVPVIRSLRAAAGFEGRIIGLAYDSLEPGLYMADVVDRSYLIPYPSAGLDALMERLRYIHSREGLDIIIPTLDSEILAFIKLRPKLEALGIRTFLPTEEQLNVRAKDKLFEFCTKHSIKVPRNTLVTSAQDIYQIPGQFTYPVVVKGIFYDAYVANNFDEAMHWFERLRTKWGLPIIVQEHLRGDEFNVVALGDGTGSTVGAVAMRKMYITDKGKGWAGVTVDDKVLIDLSRLIVKKLQWRSGMELEFMKTKDTGEYFLLEINPRFPAWTYLATGAGQNLPATLVRLAYGEQVEPLPRYEVGKIFVRYSWDLLTDMRQFEKIAVTGEA